MIRYTIQFGDAGSAQFEVDEYGNTSVEDDRAEFPEWMLLENRRCAACTLPEGSRKTCPAALAIEPVINAFGKLISFEKVHMTVELHNVTVQADISAQRAIRAVTGLMFALSDCPVLQKLRPMANFHIPFATPEHTSFRFLGNHLIAQYLRNEKGLEPDWELNELLQLLRNVHSVNRVLAGRIRAASEADAAVNSLILLDAFADQVEAGIEEKLEQLRPLFWMYLD